MISGRFILFHTEVCMLCVCVRVDAMRVRRMSVVVTVSVDALAVPHDLYL